MAGGGRCMEARHRVAGRAGRHRHCPATAPGRGRPSQRRRMARLSAGLRGGVQARRAAGEGRGRPSRRSRSTCGRWPARTGSPNSEPRRTRRPPPLPAHYVVGAGAVAQAYLAVLATSDVITELLLLDHDVLGDTNLNRHILAGWADLGEPKATTGTRPARRIRIQVFPVTPSGRTTSPPRRPNGLTGRSLAAAESNRPIRAGHFRGGPNDSRISIAAPGPQVILGGSTNGLAVEVGRYQRRQRLAVPGVREPARAGADHRAGSQGPCCHDRTRTGGRCRGTRP